MSFFKKKNSIGVDISDRSIEVMEMSDDKKIISYGRVVLEDLVVKDGVILDEEILSKKIIEALKNAKPHPLFDGENKIKAVFNIPESKVFIHQLAVPLGIKRELFRSAVEDQVLKFIPFSPEDISWDAVITGETSKEGENYNSVLYVGALNKVIDGYLSVAEKSNLEIVAIELESVALAHSLLFKKEDPLISSVIVDIGSRTTIVSIFNKNNSLMFSVNIPIAGDAGRDVLAEKLSVGKEEAERLKNTIGFDADDTKVRPILEDVFKNILVEVKEMIKYFESNSKEVVGRVVLAGGTVLIPGIEKYFSTNISIPVSVGDPIKNIKNADILGDTTCSLFFANVIGLASLGLQADKDGKNHKSIDLLAGRLSKMREKDEDFQGKSFFSRIRSKINKQEGGGSKITKTVAGIIFAIISLGAVGFVIYSFVLFPVPASFVEEVVKELPANTEIPPIIEKAIVAPVVLQESVVIKDSPLGYVNIRSGPAVTFDKVTKVYPEEVYLVLDKNDKWYKIKINSVLDGWVSAEYAEIYK